MSLRFVQACHFQLLCFDSFSSSPNRTSDSSCPWRLDLAVAAAFVSVPIVSVYSSMMYII